MSSFGVGNGQGLYHANYLYFGEEDGKEEGTDDRSPLCADQKIPETVKISFLVKVETTIRLGIKSRFSITGTNGAILGFSP